MTITRDSWLLTLTLVGAICLWLSTLPSPATWNWQQWMGNLSVAIGIVAAKLSSSFLKGANSANEP